MAVEALFPDLTPEEREDALATLRAMVAFRRRRAAAPWITRSEKRCPRCGRTKPVSEFGVSRTRPDGLQGYCRECR